MRGAKLKKDIVLNIILSFFMALGLMWVVRQAGSLFTAATLGIFLLARRIGDSTAHFLQLGTSQTLRRYVPMNEDCGRRLLFIFAGLSILFTSSIIFLVILFYYKEFLNGLIFPDNNETLSLTILIGFYSVSSIFNYFASSLLISDRKVLSTGIFNLMNSSGWFLLGFWWWQKSITVENIIRFQAVSMITISLIVIILNIYSNMHQLSGSIPLSYWSYTFKETLSYGLPRGVSPFLEMFFLSLGPWLIRGEVEEAGYLIISFVILNIGVFTVQPAARIIGIVVAKMVGEQDYASLNSGISLLLGILLICGGFSLAMLLPWAKILLHVWLNNLLLAEKVYRYSMVIILGIIPLIIYQGLREPIEMLWKRPYNLYTLTGGIGVLLICFYLGSILKDLPSSITFGYVAAFWIHGLLTLFWVRKFLKPMIYFGIGKIIAVMACIGLFNWSLVILLAPVSLLLKVTGAMVSGILSGAMALILIFYVQPSSFAQELMQFLFPKFYNYAFSQKND